MAFDFNSFGTTAVKPTTPKSGGFDFGSFGTVAPIVAPEPYLTSDRSVIPSWQVKPNEDISLIKSGVRPIFNLIPSELKGLENAIKVLPTALKGVSEANKLGGKAGVARYAGNVASGVASDVTFGAPKAILGAYQAAIKKITGYDLGDREAAQAFTSFVDAIKNPLNTATNMAEGVYKTSQENPMIIPLAIEGAKPGSVSKISNMATKPIEVGAKAIAAKLPDPNKIVGQEYRNIVSQYIEPSKTLLNAEKINGTDPIGVLQSYGNKVIPTLEQGKITPTAAGEVKDFLKEQIETLSNIKNDAVFLNENKVPFNDYADFVNNTIQAEAAKQNWSRAYMDKVTKQVSAELENYKSTYGKEGLPIPEIDKIKTQETRQSKSYNNPGKDTFQYDTHGIFGKASRSLVEMFTEDAPTKELNKLIQSHYDAIELVDSLVGRTPHGGRFTKIAERTSGGIAGTLIGGTAGHPILGYVGGRLVADYLNEVLGNNFISSPLKRILVKNAGIQDQAVVQRALKYIDENSPDISTLGDTTPTPTPTPTPKGNADI